MAYISKITLPSGGSYDIKDTELSTVVGSRSLAAGTASHESRITTLEGAIAGGVTFIRCTDAANTPQGVQWQSGTTTITGTLTPAAAKPGAFYLVPNTVSGKDNFAEYVACDGASGKVWEKIGNTEVDLSNYAQYGDSVSVSGSAANHTTGISIANHTVTNGSSTFTGTIVPQITLAVQAGRPSVSNYVTIGITGSNAASDVTFSGSTNIYSMTSAGSVTGGSAASFTQGEDSFTANVPTTPAVINTAKFSGGSYTRGSFNGGSFTQGTDSYTQGTLANWTGTVSNEVLTIGWVAPTASTFVQGTDSFTAATHGNDSFTAAALQSGFYTAGTKGSAASFTQGTDDFTANTPTAVTLPGRSTAIAALTTSTTATAAAQHFTGNARHIVYSGANTSVSVSGTTNVSLSAHSITDPGHTHTVSATGTIDTP